MANFSLGMTGVKDWLKVGSILRRGLTCIVALHPRIPLLGEVQPVRISQFDQSNLFCSGPALQLFLASYRLVHIVVRRARQKPFHAILIGETLHLMELVLEHAFVAGCQ